MTQTAWIFSIALAASLGGVGLAQDGTDDTLVIVQAQDVVWSPLNPLRGDQSPRAGALWGDRTRDEAAGFLVEFLEGFASPAHIHNITYRGVVLSGLLHNDDPDAANMWMPEGSFWTQPAGEGHVTAASGQTNLAYIEIDEGPYLVQPVDEAFDAGERPVNLHATNLVWLDAPAPSGPEGQNEFEGGPSLTVLWGDPAAGVSGALLSLPYGASYPVQAGREPTRLVPVTGEIEVHHPDLDMARRVSPGGYIGAPRGERVDLVCQTGPACTVYLRGAQAYRIQTSQPPE
ncbi:DUF4437 domain-containing protein [Oceanicaulis sp.]|uniref:DUF4437 domain-containing protein n=1 Tax=Oceanicaulis sp. TaxID=1924941 RepID=UPI003D29DFC7